MVSAFICMIILITWFSPSVHSPSVNVAYTVIKMWVVAIILLLNVLWKPVVLCIYDYIHVYIHIYILIHIWFTVANFHCQKVYKGVIPCSRHSDHFQFCDRHRSFVIKHIKALLPGRLIFSVFPLWVRIGMLFSWKM